MQSPIGGWIGHPFGKLVGTDWIFKAVGARVRPYRTSWDYPKHIVAMLDASDEEVMKNYSVALRLATGEVIVGPSISRIERSERPRLFLYCHEVAIVAPITITHCLLLHGDGELVKESEYPWTPGSETALLQIRMTHGFDKL